MTQSTGARLRYVRTVALALALALTAMVTLSLRAPAADASFTQFSIMQDDDLLINTTPARADAALAVMKSLGVNYVRVTVLWTVVAQNARSGRTARHFNPANPATYPRRNWDRFDNLVLNAQRLGIGVYMTVTGPPPRWAQATAPRRYRRDQVAWMPNPAQFYSFVKAVGIRYSGRYRKEGRNGALLPAVRLWGIWNEPNQGGWLLPQSLYNPVAHAVIPESPILYRQLYFSGHKALVDSGHGQDAILIGETAPLGQPQLTDRFPIAPKTFIRELLCVDANGNPYTGVAAQARDCASFTRNGPLQATGWAHHPYTKKVSPILRPADPNWINIANINDLPTLLDDLAVKTGHIAPNLPVLASEFGYETNPPDPFNGVSLDTQAEWMNIGDFLSWLNPRVGSTAQLQLRDAPPDRSHPKGTKAYWDTYQAGLEFLKGSQKPAYAAYGMPLISYSSGAVDPATGKQIVAFWGQLRFRGYTSAPSTPDQIYIEYRPTGAAPAAFQNLGYFAVTQSRGFFQGTIEVPGPGVIRAHWRGSVAPRDFKSRLAAVGPNGFG